MHKAGADAELHVFDLGPHGFGTGMETETYGAWQTLLTHWMQSHGWLTPLTKPQ